MNQSFYSRLRALACEVLARKPGATLPELRAEIKMLTMPQCGRLLEELITERVVRCERNRPSVRRGDFFSTKMVIDVPSQDPSWSDQDWVEAFYLNTDMVL